MRVVFKWCRPTLDQTCMLHPISPCRHLRKPLSPIINVLRCVCRLISHQVQDVVCGYHLSVAIPCLAYPSPNPVLLCWCGSATLPIRLPCRSSALCCVCLCAVSLIRGLCCLVCGLYALRVCVMRYPFVCRQPFCVTVYPSPGVLVLYRSACPRCDATAYVALLWFVWSAACAGWCLTSVAALRLHLVLAVE
jgi:hypothetical protein